MTESRLTSYALTAGGVTALAAGGAANADIITSTESIQINVNGPDTNLFTIESVELIAFNHTWSFTNYRSAWAYLGFTHPGPSPPAAGLANVASGYYIGAGFVGTGSYPHLSNSRYWSGGCLCYSTSGLSLGNSMIAGMVVSEGGSEYYAWVNYSLGWNGNEYDFTINSWAYNDVAGEGIIAGQNAAAGTPVPGLGGLAALAIGAAGVRSRRQRNVA